MACWEAMCYQGSAVNAQKLIALLAGPKIFLYIFLPCACFWAEA